jgi:transcriptional regulator with XRE-family HTH domain
MEDQQRYALSNRALLAMVGAFIRQSRLRQNRTQQSVADAAGINRTTLVQLEKGEGGTLLTFVQVLRALNLLESLSAFEFKQEISPLLLAEMEKKMRKRARGSRGNAAKC